MTADDNPRVFVPPPLIFAVLLGVGLFIDRDAIGVGFQFIASALAMAGLGLIGTALGMFGRSKTRPEPWQPAAALVTSGVYRFTRNPMYLGMAALSLAVALFFGSLPAMLFTLLAAIIIDQTVITREEAYLERRFGTEYHRYRNQVRRWL